MPRKPIPDNLEGDDTILVGVRVPAELVKRLDNYVDKRGTNRTIEVIRGVEFLVSSLECPICNALNSGGSSICSVCGSPLNKYKEMLNTLLSDYESIKDIMMSIKDKNDKSIDRYNKLIWLINRESDLVKSKLMDVIQKYADKYSSLTNGISNLLNFRFERIENGSKYANEYLDLIPYESEFIHVGVSLEILSCITKLNELKESEFYDTDKLPYSILLKLDSANREERVSLVEFDGQIDLGDNILDIIEALIDSNLPSIRDEIKSNNKS